MSAEASRYPNRGVRELVLFIARICACVRRSAVSWAQVGGRFHCHSYNRRGHLMIPIGRKRVIQPFQPPTVSLSENRHWLLADGNLMSCYVSKRQGVQVNGRSMDRFQSAPEKFQVLALGICQKHFRIKHDQNTITQPV